MLKREVYAPKVSYFNLTAPHEWRLVTWLARVHPKDGSMAEQDENRNCSKSLTPQANFSNKFLPLISVDSCSLKLQEFQAPRQAESDDYYDYDHCFASVYLFFADSSF